MQKTKTREKSSFQIELKSSHFAQDFLLTTCTKHFPLFLFFSFSLSYSISLGLSKEEGQRPTQGVDFINISTWLFLREQDKKLFFGPLCLANGKQIWQKCANLSLKFGF